VHRSGSLLRKATRKYLSTARSTRHNLHLVTATSDGALIVALLLDQFERVAEADSNQMRRVD
jgi:hypothetical protein